MEGTIESVESFEIAVPLPHPLRLGEIYIPEREYVVVFVRDTDGVTGSAYGLSRNAPVSATIRKTVAPFWANQSIENHDQLYAKCSAANVCLGTNGIFWRALSLFDCALHDLMSRRKGVPLSQYLNGRGKRPATILVGGYPTPDETRDSLARELERLVSRHPGGIKIASCGQLARDTMRLRVAREVVPDSIPLMIDMHWSTDTSKAAIKAIGSWEEFNIGWVEDPFPFDDFENLRVLSTSIGFPVAQGDEQSGVRNFVHLMDLGRVGIVRLDATVCGGVRAFASICGEARQRRLPVSCHVHHHLHAQLSVGIEGVEWVEYMLPESGLESIHLCWKSDLRWDQGGLVPSDDPGNGIHWDEAQLRRYRCS